MRVQQVEKASLIIIVPFRLFGRPYWFYGPDQNATVVTRKTKAHMPRHFVKPQHGRVSATGIEVSAPFVYSRL
jgi:hypothetical protein